MILLYKIGKAICGYYDPKKNHNQDSTPNEYFKGKRDRR